MLKLRKILIFLFVVLFCSFLVGDDYCNGIIANAIEAYCEGNTVAFEFWYGLAVDYC